MDLERLSQKTGIPKQFLEEHRITAKVASFASRHPKLTKYNPLIWYGIGEFIPGKGQKELSKSLEFPEPLSFIPKPWIPYLTSFSTDIVVNAGVLYKSASELLDSSLDIKDAFFSLGFLLSSKGMIFALMRTYWLAKKELSAAAYIELPYRGYRGIKKEEPCVREMRKINKAALSEEKRILNANKTHKLGYEPIGC